MLSSLPAFSSCTAVLNGLRHYSSFNPIGPPAFVLDIDGVLIRGRRVLHCAVQAMKELCPNGMWQYPVCFLTNGGGVSEAHKAQQLSQWLGVPVHERQIILSHTPMRSLAPRLGQQPVLVVGRKDVAAVAANYGFSKVITTSQLAAALPGALPFQQSNHEPAGEAVCPVCDLGWCTEQHPVAAVLVMNDPCGEDWYKDLQLLTDVITSHGVPERQQPLPGSRPVELYFSNPDIVWAAQYQRPRFGQGAFSSALDAIHRQLTGAHLPNARWFGKPNPEPYRLAEQLLAEQAVQLGLASACDAAAVMRSSSSSSSMELASLSKAGPSAASIAPATGAAASPTPSKGIGSLFSAIFAVGDSPFSDIRGANQAGPPWVSMLVRTGVWQGPGPNSEEDPAHVVVTDVLAAVQAGLHRARSAKWHSMR